MAGLWCMGGFSRDWAMKGVFSAPGDCVYFKSQVPLHKIPVSLSSPDLHLSQVFNCQFWCKFVESMLHFVESTGVCPPDWCVSYIRPLRFYLFIWIMEFFLSSQCFFSHFIFLVLLLVPLLVYAFLVCSEGAGFGVIFVLKRPRLALPLPLILVSLGWTRFSF